ncbi:unnamed protein product [Ambrosiozyma monospora]|uniref:Unnamed protein product n=1 Tax=Ambrosiozyma monospora TaxID=43982 RepID=A0A9W7DFC8_AMBMO|nr:unnamed protein product [Ambrosiozyma monospora]
MPLSSDYLQSSGDSTTNSQQQAISNILSSPLFTDSKNPNITHSQLFSLIIQYLSSFNNPQLTNIKDELISITGLNSSNNDLLQDLNAQLTSPQLEFRLDQLYSTVNQIASNDEAALTQVKILLQKRFMLEALYLEQSKAKALRILRNLNEDYFANNTDSKLPKALSFLLIDKPKTLEEESSSNSDEQLLREINWIPDSDFKQSRASLVSEVHDVLPADKIVSPNRLVDLVSQALSYEQLVNPYHIDPPIASSNSLSLYKDVSKIDSRTTIPNKLKATLSEHENEVWIVKYSNNGRLLASGSSDNTIIIYDVENGYSVYKKLVGHTGAIIYLSWSKYDNRLMSSSFDENINIWNVETGALEKTLKNKNLFDSQRLRVWTIEFFGEEEDKFIASSPDRKLAMFNINGDLVHDFQPGLRIDDFTIVNENRLCAITHSEELIIYDLSSDKYNLLSLELLERTLTAITSCSDPNLVLISVKPDHLQLWDISNPKRPSLVNKYYGMYQGSFVVRSCLTDNNLVLGGNVGGVICVWNKRFGNLIDVIPAHHSLINCIDWRVNTSENKLEWASCSDDRTVMVWGS